MPEKLSTYRPYYNLRVDNVVIDSDVTPTVVEHLVVPAATAGVYKLTSTVVFSSPDLNDFVQFTYSSDNGTINPVIFRKESKDADDVVPFTLVATSTVAAGPMDIKLEAILEAGGQNALVTSSGILIEKIGE